MNFSWPTLTRIYNKALKNISKAFIEVKAIEIVGGNYKFDKDWYRCKNCHNLVEGENNKALCKKKKSCYSKGLENLNI